MCSFLTANNTSLTVKDHFTFSNHIFLCVCVCLDSKCRNLYQVSYNPEKVKNHKKQNITFLTKEQPEG